MKKLAQTLTVSMQLTKVELRMSLKTTITSAITSSNRGYLQRFLNLPAELLEAALRGQSLKVNKVHACALENNDKNMREEINVRAVDQKHEYH